MDSIGGQESKQVLRERNHWPKATKNEQLETRPPSPYPVLCPAPQHLTFVSSLFRAPREPCAPFTPSLCQLVFFCPPPSAQNVLSCLAELSLFLQAWPVGRSEELLQHVEEKMPRCLAWFSSSSSVCGKMQRLTPGREVVWAIECGNPARSSSCSATAAAEHWWWTCSLFWYLRRA